MPGTAVRHTARHLAALRDVQEPDHAGSGYDNDGQDDDDSRAATRHAPASAIDYVAELAGRNWVLKPHGAGSLPRRCADLARVGRRLPGPVRVPRRPCHPRRRGPRPSPPGPDHPDHPEARVTALLPEASLDRVLCRVAAIWHRAIAAHQIIFGQAGSGKTTLIKSLLGLCPHERVLTLDPKPHPDPVWDGPPGDPDAWGKPVAAVAPMFGAGQEGGDPYKRWLACRLAVVRGRVAVVGFRPGCTVSAGVEVDCADRGE